MNLINALLACSLGLVGRVELYMYKFSLKHKYLRDQAKRVYLIRKEDFLPFLNRKAPTDFKDYKRPIVEAYKDGKHIEPVCEVIYTTPHTR